MNFFIGLALLVLSPVIALVLGAVVEAMLGLQHYKEGAALGAFVAVISGTAIGLKAIVVMVSGSW